MRSIVIYNPVAGPHGIEGETNEVVRFLESEGVENLATRATLGPGDATTYAREAAARHCDVVFVAGGDGTLAQVADGLVGSETALAVLPGGTGNVFARQLNLPVAGPFHPKPLLEATRVLLAGTVLPVDLGRVTLRGGVQRHFLAWGGVGFDAMVNRAVNADPLRKRQLGLAAFWFAAFLTLRDIAGTSARLKLDGRRVNRRLLMVVANNIQLYGVVFRMAQHAVIDDGQLDVYAFQGRRPERLLLHALRLAMNKHTEDPKVDIYRVRRLEIATKRPMPVHVDGDYVGETPVIMEAVPRALNLLVPSTAPANLFSAGAGQEQPKQTAVEWMHRVATDVQNAIKERSSTV